MAIFAKIFGDPNEREIKKLRPIVEEINGLEKEFGSFSDEKLREKTKEFQGKLKNNPEKQKEILDEILPEAFGMVREAAKRTLNQRHFDAQLIGGIVLHQGKIAEMRTGEGKTLAATLPVYLNALSGKGVHVVTVNDYLAKRDAVWMGQIYHFLGLSVGCIAHDAAYLYDSGYRASQNPKSEIRNPKQIQNSNDQNPKNVDGKRDEVRDTAGGFKVVESYLRPCSRKEAYAADITYGTNNEFGFDYLRDNLIYDLTEQAQRGFHFSIVDEVDSILIDEARTPLIISYPDEESPKLYEQFAKIVPQLKENIDYNIDEKMRAVTLSEEGITNLEKILGLGNIWVEGGIRYVHHLEQALRANVLFKLDRDYVIKNGEIIIVDEFTGRMLPGRRYSEGLHQAIEAKERVRIQPESKTLATVTFQNYFRMYEKLAGMTGTAATNAEEFHKVYKLEVLTIPTNKPMIRKDMPDQIFRTQSGKFTALVQEIKKRHEVGQPVLVGTTSIEKNEILAALLSREGIPHQILNAKHHEKEGEIIAQAGRLMAVTVATNMAGRGVDIILGGNPPLADEAQKVREVGGLHIIGTERHEARRIDNQLRGRAGRQGDSGSSQFFVSLEDDLMRVFGGDRVKGLMQGLGVPEDQPIAAGILSSALESAQSKIEGYNFDIRKHVLEYDEVLNKHRDRIYRMRRETIEIQNFPPKAGLPRAEKIPAQGGSASGGKIQNYIEDEIRKIVDFHTAASHCENWNIEEISENIKSIFPTADGIHQQLHDLVGGQSGNEIEANKVREKIYDYLCARARIAYQKKEEEIGAENMRQVEKMVMLRVLDMLWMEHLENMEYLRDSVRLRAYGQRDPLIEYKNEGHKMFQRLLQAFQTGVVNMIFKVGLVKQDSQKSQIPNPNFQTNPKSQNSKNVGRNDPCPCGATHPDGRPIKFKHCHGK